MICAHIEYSDQPVHTRILIRDFADCAVRLKRTEILDHLKCIQRGLRFLVGQAKLLFAYYCQLMCIEFWLADIRLLHGLWAQCCKKKKKVRKTRKNKGSKDTAIQRLSLSSWVNFNITNTYPYNFNPLNPHFYTVKLGFTGVYIVFLFLLKISIVGTSTHYVWLNRNIKKKSEFLSENFQVLVVQFSVYLNRHVFVMSMHWYC